VFQHFGHTAAFKVYEVENDKITSSSVVETNGSGHGALAGFLQELGVNVLICGGIGGGARMALAEAGIVIYGGVTGDVEDAVAAYLAGELSYVPNACCSHHGHDHNCADHNDSASRDNDNTGDNETDHFSMG
jgi:predicted Fe-Mo cluster-binding NifX family protein